VESKLKMVSENGVRKSNSVLLAVYLFVTFVIILEMNE
jgi:hypothetical protein